MPDNKSISQLTTAEQTTSSDLFETAIPNGSLGYLSRKVSLDAIANFIAKALQYSDLQTTAKTLIGAINEAAQSGGGGGASIEEMTQAEYNALTPEQKADGTLRAITDAATSIGDIDDVNISSPADGEVLAYDGTSSKWVNREIEADAIAYDNTSSGLNATDVQAAIDELESVTTGQATLDTAKINGGGIAYTKIGKIVIVDINIRFNANIATDSDICSGLPRGSFVHFLLGVSQNIYRAYFDGTTIKMSDVPPAAYCTGMFVYKAN